MIAMRVSAQVAKRRLRNELVFVSVSESFDESVVVAVGLVAHRCRHLVMVQHRAIGDARALFATVVVMEKAWLRWST